MRCHSEARLDGLRRRVPSIAHSRSKFIFGVCHHLALRGWVRVLRPMGVAVEVAFPCRCLGIIHRCRVLFLLASLSSVCSAFLAFFVASAGSEAAHALSPMPRILLAIRHGTCHKGGGRGGTLHPFPGR
jgi:hypothetical protein